VDLFYADDVFDANYRFTDALRHVLNLIDRALDARDVPVSEIDMLSEADRTELDTFSSGAPIDA
jgi:polyketide synthase 12